MDFLRVTIFVPLRLFLSSGSLFTPYHVSSTNQRHCIPKWNWDILTIATMIRLPVAHGPGLRRRLVHRLSVQRDQRLQHRGVLVGSNSALTKALANLDILGADEYCISPFNSCFPEAHLYSPLRVGRWKTTRTKQPQGNFTPGIQKRRRAFLDHIWDVILPLLSENNVFDHKSERDIAGDVEVRPYSSVGLQPAG